MCTTKRHSYIITAEIPVRGKRGAAMQAREKVHNQIMQLKPTRGKSTRGGGNSGNHPEEASPRVTRKKRSRDSGRVHERYCMVV